MESFQSDYKRLINRVVGWDHQMAYSVERLFDSPTDL
jgi:hypothetical protein